MERIRPLTMDAVAIRATEMAARREKIRTLFLGGMMHALIAYAYKDQFSWVWAEAFDKGVVYTGNLLAVCGCFKEMHDELLKYSPDLSYECPDDSNEQESDDDSITDDENVVPNNSDAEETEPILLKLLDEEITRSSQEAVSENERD